jgi:hypothetical protein
MDDAVARSIARWPDAPAVYGWLQLDRRGNWRIRSGNATQRFERIGNAALREFIARNYEADSRGCWFFQNGPQRVYVELAYAPLVVHFEGDALFDHCGRPAEAAETFVDDEGSVLILGRRGIGLLDDRDLARYVDLAENLPRVARAAVPGRFGFVAEPSISLR